MLRAQRGKAALMKNKASEARDSPSPIVAVTTKDCYAASLAGSVGTIGHEAAATGRHGKTRLPWAFLCNK